MSDAVAARLLTIPRAFLPYRQFINWFKSGTDKIPCDAHGNKIDAHDPRCHVDAATACASPYGVGFVFTRNDPFWFLDVDHAVQAGQWSELVNWCAAWFPGAAFEVSQSGEGAHFFGSGAGVLDQLHGTRRKGLGLEIYTNGRFCAITGTNMAGDASLDFSDRLAAFLAACDLPLRDEPFEAPEGRDEAYTGPEDDDQLIAAMCAQKKSYGQAFGGKATAAQLWTLDQAALAAAFPAEGRKDGAGYDHSAVDAALMFHLSFWTGRDLPRMQRLFARWPGYRPSKYEGRGEYRMDRVLNIGARNPKVYDKPRIALPPAPGSPELAARLGTPLGWLEVKDQPQHFAGCVYVEETHSVMMPDGRMLRPHQFDAIMGGYQFEMNEEGKAPTKSAFECFTQSRHHRFPKAVGTCFRPREAPASIGPDRRVNVWFPPVIDEAPGDVEPFLSHLALLIPDARDRRIMLAYMRAVVQKPGWKFQWAPVVQGVPGNGKSLLIRVLSHAVGVRYSHLPKASQITEKFNSWISGNIFIGVEEIKIGDKKREILDDLKDAITNDRLEIRKMGAEKYMADNVTNWFFCTNHKDAVPIDRNERRYAPFYTAQQTKEDLKRDGMTGEYFVKLYDWLKQGGGYQAVSWFLRNTPIDPEFDPTGVCQRAPETSSLGEAVEAGLGRIEQEILEAIHGNEYGFRGGWISGHSMDAYLEKKGTRTVGPNKKIEILASLGYSLACRSTKIIDNVRPRLYHKNGKRIDDSAATDEFMAAQMTT